MALTLEELQWCKDNQIEVFIEGSWHFDKNICRIIEVQENPIIGGHVKVQGLSSNDPVNQYYEGNKVKFAINPLQLKMFEYGIANTSAAGFAYEESLITLDELNSIKNLMWPNPLRRNVGDYCYPKVFYKYHKFGSKHFDFKTASKI